MVGITVAELGKQVGMLQANISKLNQILFSRWEQGRKKHFAFSQSAFCMGYLACSRKTIS